MEQVVEKQNNKIINEETTLKIQYGEYTVYLTSSSDENRISSLEALRSLLMDEMAKQVLDVYNEQYKSNAEEYYVHSRK